MILSLSLEIKETKSKSEKGDDDHSLLKTGRIK